MSVSTSGTTATSGSIGLNLANTTNIQDVATNNLSATTPVVGQAYAYDTVAPPAPAVSSSSTQNNRVTLTFSDTEAGVTFECQFEATGWVVCTSPFQFGPGSQFDGTHNYSVRAVDAAGNRSAATTVQQAA